MNVITAGKGRASLVSMDTFETAGDGAATIQMPVAQEIHPSVAEHSVNPFGREI